MCVTFQNTCCSARCAACYRTRFKTMCFGLNDATAATCAHEHCNHAARGADCSFELPHSQLPPEVPTRRPHRPDPSPSPPPPPPPLMACCLLLPARWAAAARPVLGHNGKALFLISWRWWGLCRRCVRRLRGGTVPRSFRCCRPSGQAVCSSSTRQQPTSTSMPRQLPRPSHRRLSEQLEARAKLSRRRMLPVWGLLARFFCPAQKQPTACYNKVLSNLRHAFYTILICLQI